MADPALPTVKDPGIYPYWATPPKGRKLNKSDVRYRVVFQTPDGKQSTKRGFLTLEEARNFKADNKVRINQGEYVPAVLGKITVDELAGPWLKKKKASLKKSSWVHLETSWRLHVQPKWGHWQVGKISKEAVEDWIADMLIAAQEYAEERKQAGGKVSDGSSKILKAHSCLVSILDTAVKSKPKRLNNNPARGIENLPKTVKKRHVYLTADDVARLAEESKRNATLVLVLAYCGLRWGEAVALRVRDVDTAKNRLTVHENAVQLADGIEVGTTKSSRIRSVPVPRFLMERLALLIEGKVGDTLLFPHPKNPAEYMPRSKHGDGWFAGAVKRARIQRVTPHDLRHTCASLAVSAGANVMALARMLGHKDASETLNTYADLFDTDLDKVAAAMDQSYSATVTALPCQNLVTDDEELPEAA